MPKPAPNGNAYSRLSVADRAMALAKNALHDGLPIAPGHPDEASELHALLRNVESIRKHFPGDNITSSTWAMGLHAPLLLIKQIRCFHPRLLEPRDAPLRILLLGAGRDEVFDAGRWYYLAWALCGHSPRKLKITAIGPDLDDPEATQPTRAFDIVARFPEVAMTCASTLVKAFPSEGMAPDWEEYFDLVVMNHPGFVAHFVDWRGDPAWNDLISFAQVPVIGSSFDSTDLHYDRIGLAAHGRIIDQVYWNPTAHCGPAARDSAWATRLVWGGVIWGTHLSPDIRENAVSAEQEEALQWYAGFYRDFTKSLQEFGTVMSIQNVCPAQLDDTGDRVWVSDRVAIRTAGGAIMIDGKEHGTTPNCVRMARAETVEDRITLLEDVIEDCRAHESIRRALQKASNRRTGG